MKGNSLIKVVAMQQLPSNYLQGSIDNMKGFDESMGSASTYSLHFTVDFTKFLNEESISLKSFQFGLCGTTWFPNI